jgi:carbon monoxide dehydrogenase subunit G
MEWTSEVTEYEPNRKMAQRMKAGPALIESSWTFEPVEGGTKLTVVTEAETGGLLKVAGPLVNRQMKKQAEENLAKLKEVLEAQT